MCVCVCVSHVQISRSFTASYIGAQGQDPEVVIVRTCTDKSGQFRHACVLTLTDRPTRDHHCRFIRVPTPQAVSASPGKSVILAFGKRRSYCATLSVELYY